ncbi:chromate transporter [Rhodanobacter sp. FW106-PBR-LB-2-11]|uniref:chromate transporter n=1 Tax=Rhodanobacter sp. FW106-PBR-LB-2-11 TaxID=1524463 RepID=UPI003F744318
MTPTNRSPQHEQTPGDSPPGSVAEVGTAFLKLGLSSFGGPIAHLGYFHREFVERRRWLDEGGVSRNRRKFRKFV